MANYPLYEPPHRAAEGSLPFGKIEENFAYFMDVRLNRLAFFRRWLSSRFGVKAELNGAGVLALDKWADHYSGGLVLGGDDESEVFTTYQPDWTGERRGYNVLVDVAVFLGEYLILKRPQLHWTLLKDVNGTCVDEKEEPIGFTLGRPDLGGQTFFCPANLFQSAYFQAHGSRCRLGGRRRMRVIGSFAGKCRESLHIADHRDPREPFIFGDYSHGPL